MFKKAAAIATIPVLMILLAAPWVLAQTGDAPVTRPDPNDPYRVFISNDQAIYCGHAVVGSPIYDFCMANGIVPPVLYNPDGTLAGFLQYSNADIVSSGYCSTPQQIGVPPCDARAEGPVDDG